MEDDGPRIGRGDGINESVGAAFRCFDRAGADGVEGEFHVSGSERLAVGEMNVMAEMKDVGLRVGHFPFFGEVGSEIELVVALKEAVEEEEVDVGGEGVGADARVEVGGHGFEEESDSGGGVCSAKMSATGYEEKRNKGEQQIPHTVRRRQPNGFGMTCCFVGTRTIQSRS